MREVVDARSKGSVLQPAVNSSILDRNKHTVVYARRDGVVEEWDEADDVPRVEGQGAPIQQERALPDGEGVMEENREVDQRSSRAEGTRDMEVEEVSQVGVCGPLTC